MDPNIGRYSRHELLATIGETGQRRIEQSRVLVAGVGALGSVIACLLARAGVGYLRIVDRDPPELHNLQRQILYDEADVKDGTPKVVAARNALTRVNSSIEIDAVDRSIDETSITGLVDGVDLVVDALDNTAARYLINDEILRKGIPYVFGGAVENAGNVMTIIPGRTPCLRCLWPQPEKVKDHATAATVGVLSSAAATVASIETTEAFKIMTGRYEDIIPGLLIMDLWHNRFHTTAIERNPHCPCAAVK